MNVEISERDGRLVVALIGEFGNTVSRDAEKALQPVMEQDDHDVVIDCEKLEYISSTGLRLLLNIYKHQQSTGHRAIVSHLKDYVEEVFQVGGFLTIFERED